MVFEDRLFLVLEFDTGGVDAVAGAGGGVGSVVEDMAEVSAAILAHDFNAFHAVAGVAGVFDSVFVGLEEAGPAAP